MDAFLAALDARPDKERLLQECDAELQELLPEDEEEERAGGCGMDTAPLAGEFIR